VDFGGIQKTIHIITALGLNISKLPFIPLL
jgi:hypothetical protein